MCWIWEIGYWKWFLQLLHWKRKYLSFEILRFFLAIISIKQLWLFLSKTIIFASNFYVFMTSFFLIFKITWSKKYSHDGFSMVNNLKVAAENANDRSCAFHWCGYELWHCLFETHLFLFVKTGRKKWGLMNDAITCAHSSEMSQIYRCHFVWLQQIRTRFQRWKVLFRKK